MEHKDLDYLKVILNEGPDPLTLRDQFACAALTGLLANPHTSRDIDSQDYAQSAYKLANALLHARTQTKETP